MTAKAEALWKLFNAKQHLFRTARTEIGDNSLAMDVDSFRAWRLLDIHEQKLANEANR